MSIEKPVISKSLELWNRGHKIIPRGTQTMSKAPNQFVFGVHPIYIERGDGCRLQDIDGNWYVDYLGALGPIILGHNHDGTIQAVTDQLKKGITFSMMSPVEVELAELLIEVIPCADQIRYAKNGTDATLGAVRLARSYTKKPVILKPTGHYHGWGDWNAITTSITSGVPACLKNSIRTFEYNNIEDLEKHLKADDIAAVIMEPVVLDSPLPGYLAGVRELCDKYGVVLIFDEIVTGFRWSLGGAQEYYGVTPDIATFGKAVANGMPLSIIAGKEKYMKEFDNIFFSMTFGGEACSLAAAVAVVKEMKNNKQIFSHMWDKGNELKNGFNELAKKHNVKAEMIGCGPRQVVSFYEDDPSGHKDLFSQEMVKRGFIVGNIVYVTWAHSGKDIQNTIDAMDSSFAVLRKAIESGNGPDAFLEGQRSSAIFKNQATDKPKA